jgi:hypothetical protein
MVFVGALSAASGQVPGEDLHHCAVKSLAAKNLSALDYLALASMADSQRPLAMAAFRPQHQAQPAPKAPQS